MTEQTDTKAVIDAVESLAKPDTIELGDDNGAPRAVAVLVPRGKEAVSLKKFQDAYRAHPEHREGTARLESVDAFCDYVNRFKGADTSVIFATDGDATGDGPELVAVIDHHDKGDKHSGGETPPRAGRCRHVARYTFPLSEEWQAWVAADGRTQEQRAFAEFVEDRLLDIVSPEAVLASEEENTAKTLAEHLAIAFATPAQLRDLGKGLRVRVDMEAGQAHNVNTGESSLTFKEKHAEHSNAEGKPVTVPGGFLVGVPVFMDAPTHYQLCALLRYRVTGGRVSWVVKLHRPDEVFRHAFAGACEAVAKATGLPVLRGTPETAAD